MGARPFPIWIFAAACLVAARSTSAQEEVKIIQPTVDKAAGRVTLPAAFWNAGVADWVEVALSGRPSDFLHETIICVSTTRTLLENAMRDAGFRDADLWADSLRDFPRIRGDRILILVEVTIDGKKETYSLDELLSHESYGQPWNSPVGPYGFMFRGDPERTTNGPTSQTRPASPAIPAPPPDAPDTVKILRDDPQIALIFKGLQSVSQSFADHPLAYDEWPFEPLNRGRNFGLPAPMTRDVFNSNAKIPATLILQKVTEEQLLTENAKVWHDPAFREEILKHLDMAKQIDKDKAEYLALRQQIAPLRNAIGNVPANQLPIVPEAEVKLRRLMQDADLLSARIEKNYAALDAAWAAWSADHSKPATNDAAALAANKEIAGRWKEHMQLVAVRADQMLIARTAFYEAAKLRAAGGDEARLTALHGRELEASAKAMYAENKQFLDRWQMEKQRLDPTLPPTDFWVREVTQRVALAEARRAASATGETLGRDMQQPGDPAMRQLLERGYRYSAQKIVLAEQKLDLVQLEFNIRKLESLGGDPELPALRRKREELLESIRQLELQLAG